VAAPLWSGSNESSIGARTPGSPISRRAEAIQSERGASLPTGHGVAPLDEPELEVLLPPHAAVGRPFARYRYLLPE
jgi:hypothetical protein